MSQEKSFFLDKGKKTSSSEKVTFITFWLLFFFLRTKRIERVRERVETNRRPRSRGTKFLLLPGIALRRTRGQGGCWWGRKASEEMKQTGYKEVRVRGATLPATWPGPGQPETAAQPRDQRQHYWSPSAKPRDSLHQESPTLVCFNIAKKIEEYRLTCQFMTINRIKILFCLANKNFIFRLNI